MYILYKTSVHIRRYKIYDKIMNDLEFIGYNIKIFQEINNDLTFSHVY